MINIPVKETYGVVKDIGKGAIGFVKNIGKRQRGSVYYSHKKAKRNERVLDTQKGGSIWTKHHGRTQEKKYKELTANFSADVSKQVILINGIAEGTAFNQRIGRKIDMSSCSFRFNITSPADYASIKLRMLLVYDAQPNEAAFTLGELFQTDTYPADSYFNLENRDRFNVLEDKVMMINPVDSSHVRKYYYQFGKSLSKYKVTYSDTADTISSISTGSLYLLVVSNVGSGSQSTAKATVDIIGRFRYFD